QAVVEVEPFRIWRAVALRKDARPGNREAVGFHAQLLDQADVILVKVVVIVGAVGVGAVADLARRVTESVPDRRAAPILIDRALDLIGRCRSAPGETARETRQRRTVAGGRGVAVLRTGRRSRQTHAGEARKLNKTPARDVADHRFPLNFVSATHHKTTA